MTLIFTNAIYTGDVCVVMVTAERCLSYIDRQSCADMKLLEMSLGHAHTHTLTHTPWGRSIHNKIRVHSAVGYSGRA